MMAGESVWKNFSVNDKNSNQGGWTNLSKPYKTAPKRGVSRQKPVAQSQAVVEDVKQSPGGFVYTKAVINNAPDADSLYRRYKELTGRDDASIKQFLSSKQFKNILKTGVPMWMAADSVWKSFFKDLGVSPDSLSRQRRREAIKSRLSNL